MAGVLLPFGGAAVALVLARTLLREHRVARAVLLGVGVLLGLLWPGSIPSPRGPTSMARATRSWSTSRQYVMPYARGLASWWTLLEVRGYSWADIPSRAISEFLQYQRTGDLPSVVRVGPDSVWLAPSSV